MKAPLPPNFRRPVWTTSGFRRFLLVGVVVAAALVVLIVDVGPKMKDIMEHRRQPKEQAKLTGPDVFVPRAAGDTSPQALLPYEGMPAKAKDGSPIDENEESYKYMMKQLSKSDSATVSKDAKRVEYAHFGAVPEQLKGQAVKVMGLFLQSNPIRLEKPINDVEWIYRTYLVRDMSGQEGYVVDLLEKPPTLQRKAVVALTGVFLKLGTYEGQKGQVQVPFLVGKSLNIVKESAGSEASNVGTLMVVVAAGALLLVVFLTVRIGSGSGPKKASGNTVPMETAKT